MMLNPGLYLGAHMLNACWDGIHFRTIKWFVYQEATWCQLVACWQPYCSEWMIHLRSRASCNNIVQLHLCITDDLYIEHMKMQCDVVFIAIWVKLIAPFTLVNWLSWQIVHLCWLVRLQCILEFDIGGLWMIQSHTARMWSTAHFPGSFCLNGKVHMQQFCYVHTKVH